MKTNQIHVPLPVICLIKEIQEVSLRVTIYSSEASRFLKVFVHKTTPAKKFTQYALPSGL
jgi:hypothetical protein